MTARLLVDTNIWIDHLRAHDAALHEALLAERILCHPFVTGEIAMGSLKDRAEVLDLFARLPQTEMASDQEVFNLVERRHLFSLGLGWVDAHLLAATLLTPDAAFWTRDRRLHDAATALGISAGVK